MSVEAIFGDLGPVLTRWTMGGAAVGDAPEQWRALLDEPTEAELRLLALSGQFLGLVVVPTPAAPLRELADLPPLALPMVPETLRPLVRRCLGASKQVPSLLHLLARRGLAVHPADWLPKPGQDDVPALYTPWQDWAESGSAGAVLTDSSWADLKPRSRAMALTALRRKDPGAGLALLTEKAGDEPADRRLRLVECLSIGLSRADLPYLESLAKDASPRIRTLAEQLRARLGEAGAPEEATVELADFFNLKTEGLVWRKQTLLPIELKTPAQLKRRDTLFETVGLSSLAWALGLKDEELIELWPLGDDAKINQAIIGMAARSGSDAIIGRLLDRLIDCATIDPKALDPLLPRLDAAQRGRLAQRILKFETGSFGIALAIAGAESDLPISLDCPAGRALVVSIAEERINASEFEAFGLLVSAEVAGTVIDQLVSIGLLEVSSSLDLLRLNRALSTTGASRV